jgi:16S rRNA (cytosine967-C5)-methyltransferase
VLHPWLAHCIALKSARHLERLDVFEEGLVYVQDAAAALAVVAAAPEPGMFVLDACSAPGGKSFGAAIRMKNSGRILSCDLQEKKLPMISDGAKRLGLTILETRAMDAQMADETLAGLADLVIADVPCSGFGVIRKKPEIRYKKEEDIADLPALQQKIIANLAGYVKPGGVLLYSTCTLLRRENEDVVNRFLDENKEFAPEAFTLPAPAGNSTSDTQASDGMTTLWPHETGTDGFFICRLRRQAV